MLVGLQSGMFLGLFTSALWAIPIGLKCWTAHPCYHQVPSTLHYEYQHRCNTRRDEKNPPPTHSSNSQLQLPGKERGRRCPTPCPVYKGNIKPEKLHQYLNEGRSFRLHVQLQKPSFTCIFNLRHPTSPPTPTLTSTATHK